jgi:hypothetical protein
MTRAARLIVYSLTTLLTAGSGLAANLATGGNSPTWWIILGALVALTMLLGIYEIHASSPQSPRRIQYNQQRPSPDDSGSANSTRVRAIAVGLVAAAIGFTAPTALDYVVGESDNLLTAPATAAYEGLTLSVESITVTRSKTRITVTVTNNYPDMGFGVHPRMFRLSMPNGRTRSASEGWVGDLLPHQFYTGPFVFEEDLPDGTRSVTVSMSIGIREVPYLTIENLALSW